MLLTPRAGYVVLISVLGGLAMFRALAVATHRYLAVADNSDSPQLTVLVATHLGHDVDCAMFCPGIEKGRVSNFKKWHTQHSVQRKKGAKDCR